VKELVDYLEEMVAAPFLVISHNILKDSIYFGNDVHAYEGLDVDFAWLNYYFYYFDGEGIELRMVDIKVLKQQINQLQLI